MPPAPSGQLTSCGVTLLPPFEIDCQPFAYYRFDTVVRFSFLMAMGLSGIRSLPMPSHLGQGTLRERPLPLQELQT